MIQNGSSVNLGDLLRSYKPFKFVSMELQVIKGE